jgi:hypothetical protein
MEVGATDARGGNPDENSARLNGRRRQFDHLEMVWSNEGRRSSHRHVGHLLLFDSSPDTVALRPERIGEGAPWAI